MLVRKYVLISFRALNDRSPVAKLYSNVSVIEYVLSCLAVSRVTLNSAENTNKIYFQVRAFLLFFLEMLMYSA